jgi:hypothetical protein
MRVDQARQHRASMQVDDARVRAPILFEYISRLPDVYDVAVLYGDGLLNRKGRIDCDNFAVMENEIRWRRERRHRAKQGSRNGK